MILLFLAAFMSPHLTAQEQQYLLHQRGMLHETVFNTGELGRTYNQGILGMVSGQPVFQWPSHSRVTVDWIAYAGQNNSFGGGMYLAGTSTDSGRQYAFCGAVGSATPEQVFGIHSFPLELSRRENYPILADGTVNPSYDPDEAEEIIVSRWATPLGLTVTRTSRAWSHPDYDDFIIYEYEIENTGDRNGNPGTAEYSGTLTDVLVGFAWGLTPSQFGYERTYNRWYFADYEQKDLRVRFDRRRWMNYVLDRDAKPEPLYFNEWATSNSHGGGLLSPQAVGYLTLYYDTLHLAGPTETAWSMTPSDSAIVWDANGNLKQPFLNRCETSNFRSTKLQLYFDSMQPRKNPPYRDVAVVGSHWVGRGSFNVRQSMKYGVGSIMAYGPYTVPFGTKIRFAVAQVAGYGAARLEQTLSGLVDEGGSCGEFCGEPSSAPFFPVPNLWQTVTYGLDNAIYGSNYLSTHPLPQYVNSNTVTVREVADRAIQAYTGWPLVMHDSTQYWPELAPAQGVYQLPILVPSPAITVRSNALAENVIEWRATPETFTSARLQSPFSHYSVYRSVHPIGPWVLIDTVTAGDARYLQGDHYALIDGDAPEGAISFYSILTFDTQGSRSGRTNITSHESAFRPPPAPGLVFPIDKAILDSTEVSLQWMRLSAPVARYWLEVATDSGFSDRTVDSTVVDTLHIINVTVPGTYWWRVRAAKGYLWGEFSVIRSFSYLTTGVAEPAVQATEFTLAQNYPNPFNPMTRIVFTTRERAWVRLVVCDLFGREIAVLVNEEKPAGVYTAPWNAATMPTGVYFCKLSAGGFTQTRKMLLSK